MTDRPRVYKTEGFILRRRNIGEADTIFTVFSEREGKFDAVARGVRKARSRMRGHLEPLTRTKMLLARGRTLDVFTQAEMVTAYRAIREDLDRSALGMYCAELIDRFTAEHVEQPGVMGLILDVMDALESGAPPQVVRYFELKLISLMGYDLQVSACAVCGGRLEEEDALLSPSAGGLVCPGCRGAAGAGRVVSVRAVKVLRYARVSDMAAFAAVRLDEALGREVERATAEVIRYLLDRDVGSSKFVDEVQRLGRVKAPTAETGVE